MDNKKYLVFLYERDEPSGGLDDMLGSCDTVLECLEEIVCSTLSKYIWKIVEHSTLTTILEGDEESVKEYLHEETKKTVHPDPDKKYPVVVQNWTEYERGWGSRPDGISIHLSENHRNIYNLEFFKARSSGSVPDEYSNPSDNGFLADVSEEIYLDLAAEKYGLRIWNRAIINQIVKK